MSQHRVRPDVPPDCPPALADLMQRCWSHDPLLRWAGAWAGASLLQQPRSACHSPTPPLAPAGNAAVLTQPPATPAAVPCRPDAQQVVDEVRAQLMARRPQQAAAPQPPAGGA